MCVHATAARSSSSSSSSDSVFCFLLAGWLVWQQLWKGSVWTQPLHRPLGQPKQPSQRSVS
jgi:hypothetical protein